MKVKCLLFSPLILVCWVLIDSYFAPALKFAVLVFSKTASFGHESISAGKAALTKLAQFKESILKNYNMVIFLNSIGDLLNNAQQNAFERYIQARGSYMFNIEGTKAK